LEWKDPNDWELATTKEDWGIKKIINFEIERKVATIKW